MLKRINELKAKTARGEQGFTLIELLIVVAIIGILAAIAIPQFAAYRIRGFNASANSDLRNTATAQEALFADTQGFGLTANALLVAAACATPGAIITGPLNGAVIATAGGEVRNALGAVATSVGNNVSLQSEGLLSAAPVVCTTYLVVSKHLNGDRCFGRDMESQAMFSSTHTGGPGVALVAADHPAPATLGIDLVAAGSGACASWVVM